MQDKYGFIYIWYDRKHKRYYVGCHWGYEDDGYICSSTWMNQAYKRRPQDFKRRIIKRIYTSKKDLFKEEQKYLGMIKKDELGKKYYNLQNTWEHWILDENKEKSVREKISKTKKGKKLPKSIEWQLNWNESRRGHEVTGETKEKLRTANVGKSLSNETKEKLSSINKGVPKSKEAKENMSKSWSKRKSKQPNLGKYWWNNGIESIMSVNCPGDEWVRGRFYKRNEL